jgi:hypothetical protein
MAELAVASITWSILGKGKLSFGRLIQISEIYAHSPFLVLGVLIAC